MVRWLAGRGLGMGEGGGGLRFVGVIETPQALHARRITVFYDENLLKYKVICRQEM